MPAWLLPHRPSLPFAVVVVVVDDDTACLPMLVYLLPTLTVMMLLI
jgi:hypothetical protein